MEKAVVSWGRIMGNGLKKAIIVLAVTIVVFIVANAITFPVILLHIFDNDYKPVDYEGVTYMPTYAGPKGHYHVMRLSESVDGREVIYVYDRVNGVPVYDLDLTGMVGATLSSQTYVNRIYIPWSIDRTEIEVAKNVGLIICASTNIRNHENIEHDGIVIPKVTYDQISNPGDLSRCIPANVAYLFNYDEAPNEGYFFVDLSEEPGKLTKPPYNPIRKGYTFGGWYTEPECINEWNFDESISEISAELRLYARWIEN